MMNVSGKEVSFRKAIAQGEIFLSSEAFQAIQEGRNPKGNVLVLAKVAGIMAAKKTSEAVPLCHSLPLDHVQVSFYPNSTQSSIRVNCEVSATAKTGVEMEALSGVNGALLTIYDLSKIIDPVMKISEIRLNSKVGGKGGLWLHPEFTAGGAAPVAGEAQSSRSEGAPLSGIRSSVITISDRVSQGKLEDTSGPFIHSFLTSMGSQVSAVSIAPDEKGKIQAEIHFAIRAKEARLIVTTGGTGLGPRDITPEAIQELSDRIIPGIGECLRSQGSRSTPMAWLSRSLGARIGSTLVIALPGSRPAVEEGMNALKDILPHALTILQGGKHD